jgi:polyisoprenoid-binding protein YceI
MKTLSTLALMILVGSSTAFAAPVVYEIDPSHTYPSFEADHMGISVWRGKFNTSAGRITLDKVAGSGTVEVTIDTASVDYGHDKMNEHARKDDLLDVAKYPQATYAGTLAGFVDGEPTRVDGKLTLHGVTKPLTLTIDSFKCIEHPRLKREVCGADASATFKRDDFGIDAGKAHGILMDVTLRIQVEARAEPSAKAS